MFPRLTVDLSPDRRFTKVCLVFMIAVVIVSSQYAALALETNTYKGSVKPVAFYFHYLDPPSQVGGLETKYVMNTSRAFRFNTNRLAYTGSLFKPVGLPKLSVNFYLSPSLLAPVKVDGDWSVSVWVNSTAYKPVSFNTQYREVSSDGSVLWDSGQLSPTITSSIGNHIDVPIQDFVLTSRLTHTFQAGSTILVLVEVNAGSSSALRLWYDSRFYPSKVTLPVSNYARPTTANLQSYDGSRTDLFDHTWSIDKRIVLVRVNISDPFSGYDVNTVTMQILNNGTKPVSEAIDMKPESAPPRSLLRVYSATWTYPESAQIGNYTVRVDVVDNTGAYRIVDEGTPDPNVETLIHWFQIGPVTYHSPLIRVLDVVGDPVRDAQVYVTFPNGVRDALPRYTGIQGNLTLVKVVPGQYGLTILWRDRVVKQTTLSIDSDGPFQVAAQIYELQAEVTDNAGKPVKGANVLVFSRSGLGYGFNMTSASGVSLVKLPVGNYSVAVHFSEVYWLTPVSVVEERTVSVENNVSVKITLANYPPPIYGTTGFLSLVAVIVVLAIGTFLVISRRKNARALIR